MINFAQTLKFRIMYNLTLLPCRYYQTDALEKNNGNF
jgi:hypothetical protein